MKVYQTNRLFYGKWLYRVETSVPGANLLKRWGVEETIKFCNDPNDSRYRRSWAPVDKAQLLKYVKVAGYLFDKGVQMRAEWSTLNYYTSDLSLYKDIQLTLKDWVVSLTEPISDADIESLQAKESLVLCNELPHGKFKYRLYMRYQMPGHQKINFLNWLKNYKDTVQPSKTTLKWLEGRSPYMQDPFIYVSDRNNLLMVNLFLSGHVKKVEEFVLRDA